MNKVRPYVMIGLSIVAGLVAVLLGTRWLAGQAAMSTQSVVVAARDIEPGSALEPAMLQLASWPAGNLPAGSTGDLASLNERVLRSGLVRGEPVVDAKLAPPGTKGGLSAVIGNGRRAITVKVNEVIGVAGFALPGNYVDVLVNAHDQQDKPVSKIVLERILVLAVAQEASRDDTKPRVVSAVTLEVTPEQAEKLDLARSVGNLSLALRNQVDQAPVSTAGVRPLDLLQAPASPPPVQRQVRRPGTGDSAAGKAQIEVIRGVQKSRAEF